MRKINSQFACLNAKLEWREIHQIKSVMGVNSLRAHPWFIRVPGGIAPWEKVN